MTNFAMESKVEVELYIEHDKVSQPEFVEEVAMLPHNSLDEIMSRLSQPADADNVGGKVDDIMQRLSQPSAHSDTDSEDDDFCVEKETC